MELKVVCQCGQKFKFDVEPVNGRMPFAVNCPVCNVDGTATANQMLALQLVAPSAVLADVTNSPPPAIAPVPAAPPPPITPVTGGLRLNRAAQPEVADVPAAPTGPANGNPTPPAIGAIRPFAVAAASNPPKKTSFAMGLLGGFIGALVGVIIYFLIFKFTGVRLKLLAVGVGALAGWFADFLGKGEGSKELGGITAVLVLAGIVGAQYFVALGWWHERYDEALKDVQSAYANAVIEAKAAVQAVPTGSDAEIRAYMMKQGEDKSIKLEPTDFSDDDVKEFRTQLPEYKLLASGQLTKDQYDEKYGLKSTEKRLEQDSDEGTFKGVFLLLLLSKANLFSLAAAAALAFKLSTNA